MRAKSGWVRVTLAVAVAFGLNGCSDSTQRPSTSSTINAIYIATQNDRQVRSYSIDRTSGSISPIRSDGSPVATGAQPSAMVVSYDASTVYLANAGNDNIDVHAVNTEGSLAASSSALPAGSKPVALAIDPTGTLLFAADYGSDAITVFGTDGGLLVTAKTAFAIQAPAAPSGSGPVALVVAPVSFPCTDNRTTTPVSRNCYALYAANQLSGTITAYDYFVDSTGTFVRGSVDMSGNFIVGGTVTGSPYTVGTSPSGIAFSRCAGVTSTTRSTACSAADQNNIFVANAGSNSITIFTACIQIANCYSGQSSPDGTLSVVGTPVGAGSGPTTVLVNSSADFVYVLDSGSNQISEYQYSPTTGTLTSLGATTPSSSALISAAITPNVANTSSAHNWVVVTSNGALSAYSVGSDGTLNPASSGQLTIQGQPSAIVIR